MEVHVYRRSTGVRPTTIPSIQHTRCQWKENMFDGMMKLLQFARVVVARKKDIQALFYKYYKYVTIGIRYTISRNP